MHPLQQMVTLERVRPSSGDDEMVDKIDIEQRSRGLNTVC